ncbi:MAG: hypothetical protein IPI81_08750 [Flavobacteriales bacterium]|nr:hypothetical protein [Flavobacteriales bacterium]MCC6938955.1 hypothetical protein [Flavobacteriales bacterium]
MRPYSVLLAILLMVPTVAQNRSRSRIVSDSLKVVIADLHAQIERADSMHHVKDGIDHRAHLAVLVKPKEAMRLAREAVAMADGAGPVEDAMAARELLAAQLYRTGDHRHAFEEASTVMRMRNELMNDRALESALVLERAVTRSRAEQDSLRSTMQQRVDEAIGREGHMEAAAERWMFFALGVALLAVVLIAILLVSSDRRTKLFRQEMDVVRAEVAELRKPKNTYRQPEVVPSSPIPSPNAAPQPASLRLPADETLRVMFLRTAPERLRTFREAYARGGDLEKAVWVVHTLKPLLVGVDADHFTGICARLVAPEAAGTAAWESDANALCADIDALIAQG